MLVCFAKDHSVFIEFRLLPPVCVLLKPVFIIVILLSVFVYSGHFLLPQCIEKRVSTYYTVCVMDMGICSFYNNFWGKKSASAIFQALFENLWFLYSDKSKHEAVIISKLKKQKRPLLYKCPI